MKEKTKGKTLNIVATVLVGIILLLTIFSLVKLYCVENETLDSIVASENITKDLNEKVNKKIDSNQEETVLLINDLEDEINYKQKLTKEKIEETKTEINTNLDIILKDLNTNLNKVQEYLNTNLNVLEGNVNKNTNSVKEEINTNLETIKNDINTNLDIIGKYLNTSINTAENNIKENTNNAKEAINTNLEKIKNDINTNLSLIQDDINTNLSLIHGDINTNLGLVHSDIKTNIGLVHSDINTNINDTRLLLETKLNKMSEVNYSRYVAIANTLGEMKEVNYSRYVAIANALGEMKEVDYSRYVAIANTLGEMKEVDHSRYVAIANTLGEMKEVDYSRYVAIANALGEMKEVDYSRYVAIAKSLGEMKEVAYSRYLNFNNRFNKIDKDNKDIITSLSTISNNIDAISGDLSIVKDNTETIKDLIGTQNTNGTIFENLTKLDNTTRDTNYAVKRLANIVGNLDGTSADSRLDSTLFAKLNGIKEVTDTLNGRLNSIDSKLQNIYNEVTNASFNGTAETAFKGEYDLWIAARNDQGRPATYDDAYGYIISHLEDEGYLK